MLAALKVYTLYTVAAIAVAGCGGRAVGPAGNITLTLGSAALDGSGFVPLDGSQTLVPGAQGGFHVWLKYRVRGMAPATLAVHRTARRVSDDALVLTTDGTVDVGAAGSGGYWELPAALPNFICPTPLGVDVIDQALSFDVELSDDKGTLLARSGAEATVHCPAGTEGDLCRRICAG